MQRCLLGHEVQAGEELVYPTPYRSFTIAYPACLLQTKDEAFIGLRVYINDLMSVRGQPYADLAV